MPFKKELEKYKNINEDEILSKLSEDELKQLESVLDDLDPEVRIIRPRGLPLLQYRELFLSLSSIASKNLGGWREF